MSHQSRIDDTGLQIGDPVVAFKSPTAARRDPRQPDFFDAVKVFDRGTVNGFLTFPAHVLIMVTVEGDSHAHPYPVGVWHLNKGQ